MEGEVKKKRVVRKRVVPVVVVNVEVSKPAGYDEVPNTIKTM
jgi:hypothetical protein